MSETKRNKERVDQAWNKLYDRLDADGLLLSDRQNRKRLSAFVVSDLILIFVMDIWGLI